MGLRYNPFTGSFDLTRSPGSYLDGEVAAYSDLPLDTAAAPLNSAWLVRGASGLWLLSRKPAGIYIRTATTGDRDADYTYAGTFPDVFSDANFVVYNDADSTKNLKIDASALTTGTTRTLTVPDKSGTIATTDAADLTSGTLADARLSANVPLKDAANTFSANQTFSGTNSVAPNQTAASGSSIMTRDLVDARYAIRRVCTYGNNQTAANDGNFFDTTSQGFVQIFAVPSKIEIHAEVEFTSAPLAADPANFEFRVAIRNLEGASMNSALNTDFVDATTVTKVSGFERYVIRGEITSFPATWATRISSYGAALLTLDGGLWNRTGGSLTLTNNQQMRCFYTVFL